MQVSASIVIYRTPPSTFGVLIDSLCRDNACGRVIIVDNSPNPAKPEIPQCTGKIEYLAAGKNLGYGRGHNLGISRISHAEYPFHLIVNPDVTWDGMVVAELKNYMEKTPDVALVMPKVLYPDMSLQYLCKLLPTPADLLARRFLPAYLARKLVTADFDLRFTEYKHVMNVPYLSGCFMFLRRSAFDAIGGFDERFFMYPEDVDLTRRLHRRWRTVFYPGAHIVHAHGKASYKSGKMLLIHLWNMAKYFNKWGWFRDRERGDVNRRTLAALKSLEPSPSVVK